MKKTVREILNKAINEAKRQFEQAGADVDLLHKINMKDLIDALKELRDRLA